MQITKQKLKKIIQEELQKLLYEEEPPTSDFGDYNRSFMSPYGDTSFGRDIADLAGQSTELTPTSIEDIRQGLADVKASDAYTDQPVSREAWDEFTQGVDRFRAGPFPRDVEPFPERPEGRVEGAPLYFSSYEDQPSGEGIYPDMPRHKTEFQVTSPELAAHYKARKATPKYQAAVKADRIKRARAKRRGQ